MKTLLRAAFFALVSASCMFTQPANAQQAQTDGTSAGGNMKIVMKSAGYAVVYGLNGSPAAKQLYEQLPLTVKVEPYSTNEMIFYPPKKLDTRAAPLSNGETGSLSYYAPWGNVVMFYAPCNPNGSLYGLGEVISGVENISKLKGSITVEKYSE